MQITLNEAKRLLLFTIENNKSLQDRGETPITISLSSEAGIGKSAVCEQIAKEINTNFIKLNLSMLSEVSDLVGYPYREYYLCKDNECKWVSSELLKLYIELGWTATENTRMSYAIPKWIQSIDPSKPTILLLDDVTRAPLSIQQAVMEIIYKQEYISWKLPKYSTIILTENPNNGSYFVNDLDEAMQSRYLKLDVKFDIKDWAEYAENSQIDGRCINFFLNYWSEILKETEQHDHIANPRSYTLFSNVISGIKDWSTTNGLSLIMQFASAAFPKDTDNVIGGLFTTFIHNKLDKLISPQDMLTKSWETVKNEIKDCVYENDTYKPVIASILHTRLLNYIRYYFSQPNAKSDIVQNRLLDFINSPEIDNVVLFSEEFLYNIIKILIKEFPQRMNKLIMNPKIRKQLL